MSPRRSRIRTVIAVTILVAVLLGFAGLSLGVLQLLKLQPAGVDFAGLWGGAKAALTDVGRLYDFRYVSELQGWPLGADKLRPYAYPPSALLLLAPFALMPWSLGYQIWTVLTGGLFIWTAWKSGAPKWFVLVPWMAFAAFCGQVTFLLGALVLAGLQTADRRPVISGLLFGVAAAVKPQLLMLLPLALVAEGRWRTIVATGIAGLGMVAASVLVWGLSPWFEWLDALPRFEHLVSHARLLVANSITPYAALIYWKQNGSWALLLAPLAAFWVWATFRRGGDLADRTIVLLGGAFLISPYAMNYELALFAPATAVYLSRTSDRAWPAYVAAAILQALVLHAPFMPWGPIRPAFFALAATLSLPALRALARLSFPRPEPEPSLIPNR